MHIRRIIILVGLIFIIFSCAQAQEDEKFRFVVIGCAHLGLCDFHEYELAAEKIKEYNPDFVLFLGSIVDNVGELPNKERDYSTKRALEKGIKLSSVEVQLRWQKFDKISSQLGVPIYDVPSERTIPANNVNITEKEFLKRYHKRYYSYEYKNNLFILLDSESHNRPDQKKRGLIDGKQLDFLKSSLANYSRYNNVFIAMHQSAWDTRFLEESRWLEIVHPLINKKVNYVFGACLHFVGLKKIDNVSYVTSGAAPCWPDPKSKKAFPHFLIVDVKESRVSIEVVPLRPIAIDNFMSPEKREKESLASRFRHRIKFFIKALIKTINARIKTMKINIFRNTEIKKNQYSAPAAVKSLQAISSSNELILRLISPLRDVYLQPDKVISALTIKPEMTILDVGAGLGVFTFRFAEALQGSGKVFATDTDSSVIAYIKEKAEGGGYKNIFPVLVSGEGVDPFYKEHVYDIIFMSEVYEIIWHPDNFLEALPLKKGTGRLYILYYKENHDFSEVEFGDFKKVVSILATEGRKFPIFKRLRKEVQSFVEGWHDNADVPLGIKMLIIKDFDTMLSDRLLLNDLIDYYYLCHVKEKVDYPLAVLSRMLYQNDWRLAKWLISFLEEKSVLDSQKGSISDVDKRSLRMLNRVLLTGVFRMQELSRSLLSDYVIYPTPCSVKRKLAAAGYEFVCEYDTLPLYHFLEFKRKD